MDKSKQSGSHETARKGFPFGLIAVAVAVGVVIGSAGTYFLSQPATAPVESAAPAAPAAPVVPAAGGPLPVQVTPAPPQNQYTPAPQPPGEAPPGKVWSVEHGHWHDAPVSITPAPAPAVPGATPASPSPAAAPVLPRIFTPPPTPAEKK